MNQNTATTPANDSNGFEFKLENADAERNVYRMLARHQATDTAWELHALVAWLQLWMQRMVDTFDLQISEVALCIDWLPARRLGHFRPGVNGFGLRGEIALNRRHLQRREPWQLLGTLLHELLHAWQEVHGKSGKRNYHNTEFREKARSLGLAVDTRGYTQYEADSPFFALLNRFGVEFPDIPPVQLVTSGSSRLKKWSCRCSPPVNVRVAVAHFRAKCLWCGNEFQLSE